jgi:hypothetical protein
MDILFINNEVKFKEQLKKVLDDINNNIKLKIILLY